METKYVYIENEIVALNVYLCTQTQFSVCECDKASSE